jgi:2-oxoglutarate ferredoxin oxidoreductase subunit delta
MAETPKKSKEEPPRIDIYKAWCKSCGICTAFCPRGVLAKDEEGYPYVKEPEKCINCGWCEMHCPDFAITVEQRKKHESHPSEKVEERIEKEG